MNTFKHKSLYAALAGLGALGATGVAQAVSVNHDGLGQVLIYPYYTVRTVPTGLVGSDAAYNSLLSVVNSTASVKAVKVRFLEGKNSREVLDFNLYLSAKDVWTTAIIPTTDGAGIFTADKSCTVPTVSSSSASPTQFVNFAYTGSNDDKGGTSLDRTREGYVEIIEMADYAAGTSTHTAATHVSGVPPCTLSALTAPTADNNALPGAGGLFGSMTLVNVLKGEDFGYDPTALDGFSTTKLWFPEGDVRPTLAFVNPKTSVVVSGFNVWVTTGYTGERKSEESCVEAEDSGEILMRGAPIAAASVVHLSAHAKTENVRFAASRYIVDGIVGGAFNTNGEGIDDMLLALVSKLSENDTVQEIATGGPIA